MHHLDRSTTHLSLLLLFLLSLAQLDAQEFESPLVSDRYFSPMEFEAFHPRNWNLKSFHHYLHSIDLAEVTYEMTGDRFAAEVALISEIDPGRPPGTPPRVPATLEWMKTNKALLTNRFQWTDLQFRMAQAMIQRTEHRFDDQPRAMSHHDYYQTASPVARYRRLLQGLPPEEQAYVLERAAVLAEYAGKAAPYTLPFRLTVVELKGLANERAAVGEDGTFVELARGIRKSLVTIGEPERFAFDRSLAAELGIAPFSVPTWRQVFLRLDVDRRLEFTRNVNLGYLEIESGRWDPNQIALWSSARSWQEARLRLRNLNRPPQSSSHLTRVIDSVQRVFLALTGKPGRVELEGVIRQLDYRLPRALRGANRARR